MFSYLKIIILIFLLGSCSAKKEFHIPDSKKIEAKEVSFLLYDTKRDDIVDSYNIEAEIIPASIFKLLTAYAMLELFPINHKFKTNILYQGHIKESVLNGNLIIEGRGDPSLGFPDLQNIVLEIKARGIKAVTGILIYRNDYFITRDNINNEQPSSALYNPGVSSLTFRDNYFLINKESKNGEYNLVPNYKSLSFKKNKKQEEPQFLGKGLWKVKKIYNNLALPVKDNGRYVANGLKTLLENEGVSINGITQGYKNNAKLLFSYEGKELKDIVKHNLRNSHNLTSELFLLHIAKKLECQNISIKEAANCMKNWYDREFPFLDWQELNWQNGSGLASKSTIYIENILAVLKQLKEKKYGNYYANSFFPISALEGTLRRRFRKLPLNIWAKTGSMHFVSSLAGYVNVNQKKHIFVIVMNDKRLRKKLDELQTKEKKSYKEKKQYKKLIKYADKWRRQILKQQENLIYSWAGITPKNIRLWQVEIQDYSKKLVDKLK